MEIGGNSFLPNALSYFIADAAKTSESRFHQDINTAIYSEVGYTFTSLCEGLTRNVCQFGKGAAR